MSEELEKAGLYIDDIYRLRAQNPKITSDTVELREECIEYAEKLQEFHKLIAKYYKILKDFGNSVEKEKLAAIRAQNELKTMSKQRLGEQQIYQSKIQEQNIELERLKNEYQYFQRIESEQQEIINNFLLNQ